MRKLGMILALLSCVLIACGGGGKQEAKGPDHNPCNPCAGAEKSLYDRLGGKEAITAVVDQFVANVVADDRINGYFAEDKLTMDVPTFKGHLVDQICQATGGPCTYTGRDMKTAHEGMGVTEEAFNALVEDLVKALDQFNVPEREKTELLGALAGMKGDIVEE